MPEARVCCSRPREGLRGQLEHLLRPVGAPRALTVPVAVVLLGAPTAGKRCTRPASAAGVARLQGCRAALGHVEALAIATGLLLRTTALRAPAPVVSGVAALAAFALLPVDAVVGLLSVGAPDLPDPDEPKRDVGAGNPGPELVRIPGADLAGPAPNAGLAGRLVRRRGRIQPVHLRLHVVPQRKHEDHPPSQRRTHALHATLGRKVVRVLEGLLLRQAHLLINGIAVEAIEVLDLGVLNDLPILHIQPPNLLEVSGVCAVVSQELRYHCHGLGGVDRESRAVPVEVLVPEAEMIKIAAVLIADALVAAATVTLWLSAAGAVLGRVTALVRPGALATQRPDSAAGVRSEGRGLPVCLPDVHLGAARAVVTHGPGCLLVPALEVRLALDELEVVGALRVAVARAVLCAGRVVAAARAAVLLHLHEVYSTVEATLQRGNVHVNGELLVQQLEHLVVALVAQHVEPGADGLAALERQVHAALDGLHAVGVHVVLVAHALDCAARGTGAVALADARVPSGRGA
mmetsp:Transcript_108476/g.324390  ORF Transcript_108476/g.324390 Transcript_108476/m.324390 type:complete len:519 (+) Transcript_108476:545-2101(+)